MKLPDYFMVLDVESIGLHGEGYAWACVVINGGGERVSSFHRFVDPHAARGSLSGRQWVSEHADPEKSGWSPTSELSSPYALRDSFWAFWKAWERNGAVLAADCPWPVETNFLSECVADRPDDRSLGGPYPLIDIASVLLAAWMDPKAEYDRLPDELPRHDPLADARQSARLLATALKKIRVEKLNGGHQ